MNLTANIVKSHQKLDLLRTVERRVTDDHVPKVYRDKEHVEEHGEKTVEEEHADVFVLEEVHCRRPGEKEDAGGDTARDKHRSNVLQQARRPKVRCPFQENARLDVEGAQYFVHGPVIL